MIEPLLRGLILAMAGMLWAILLTRVVGLRSFSKMTNFDFIMTVAVGSLLAGASQSTETAGFLQALAAMAGLFALQVAIAWARRRSDRVRQIMRNTPILLMRNGEMLDAAMDETRVTRADLLAKLRAANISDPAHVQAVVLETTGDISILAGPEPAPEMLDEVRRVAR